MRIQAGYWRISPSVKSGTMHNFSLFLKCSTHLYNVFVPKNCFSIYNIFSISHFVRSHWKHPETRSSTKQSTEQQIICRALPDFTSHQFRIMVLSLAAHWLCQTSTYVERKTENCILRCFGAFPWTVMQQLKRMQSMYWSLMEVIRIMKPLLLHYCVVLQIWHVLSYLSELTHTSEN